MIKIPIRILIVDDEKDFVDMLALRLETAGQTVFKAHSGEAGLKQLQKNPADVVLLDIRMPGMDGIDVLRQIKQHHPLVEVILLTGHGTVQTAVEGMKLGAYDYLIKPADFDELVRKLEGARKRRDEHEERIRAAEAKAIMRKKRGIF
jgi:DNA-binding NtrC family response regulator